MDNSTWQSLCKVRMVFETSGDLYHSDQRAGDRRNVHLGRPLCYFSRVALSEPVAGYFYTPPMGVCGLSEILGHPPHKSQE